MFDEFHEARRKVRAEKQAGPETGSGGKLALTDANLTTLVDAFYARVRQDPDLGPIFNDAIHDWPEHLGRLSAFWSSVMLSSGRYKGRPVPAHKQHEDRIEPAHFTRWLAIWGETTDDLMTAEAAKALQDAAARIGESLKLALFFTLDGPPGQTRPGTRLPA